MLLIRWKEFPFRGLNLSIVHDNAGNAGPSAGVSDSHLSFRCLI